MRHGILFSIFLTAVLAGATFASEVTKIAAEQNEVLISQEEGRKWGDGDRVCIYREETHIACGVVTKFNSKHAKVELEEHTAQLERGDQAFLVMAQRELASLQAVSKVEEKVRPVYNLTGGINTTVDIIHEKIEFQGFLTPSIAIGIQPAFARKTSHGGGAALSSYGFMFTMNYYHREFYQGFWLQAGSGLYLINETSTGESRNHNVPVLSVIVGWRESWGLGLNIGMGLGVRYIAFPDLALEELKVKGLQPTFVVDIGFQY